MRSWPYTEPSRYVWQHECGMKLISRRQQKEWINFQILLNEDFIISGTAQKTKSVPKSQK